jgi:hypothetical protein
MYREYSKLFLPPEDDDAQIWQFMDFPEFVSVLEQRSLFFSKAMNLFDPYEGKLPQGNKSAKFQYDNKSDNSLLPSILREKTHNTLRNVIVINSWHINEFESAAMWNLYSQLKTGISIQSTYDRLCKSFDINLDDDIFIGKVNYIDYSRDSADDFDLLELFVTKRKHFEYEQELRVITTTTFSQHDNRRLILRDATKELYKIEPFEQNRTNLLTSAGRYVPVDLEHLLDKIFVAPLSEDWYVNLVKSVVSKYGISQDKVVKSNLYSTK